MNAPARVWGPITGGAAMRRREQQAQQLERERVAVEVEQMMEQVRRPAPTTVERWAVERMRG